MKYLLIFIVVLLLTIILFLALPNKLNQNTKILTTTIEVAPGEFLEYKEYRINWSLRYDSFIAVHTLPIPEEKFFQKDTRYLSIPWDGLELFWIGVGDPVSIRLHDGLLYMIVYDCDTNIHKIRLRYYKQAHDVLAEISSKDYPKEIAVCNLNGNDSRRLDDIGKLQQSTTARIWYNLEYGVEYYEQPEIDMEFLKDYIRKYNIKEKN